MGILKPAKDKSDGLIFLILGCLTFLLIGFSLEAATPVSTVDFRVVYFSARCLLEHGDPYNEAQLADTYRRDGGEAPNDTPALRKMERQYIYFPTALPFTVFFALFPFGLAHILWLAVTASSLVVGSCLVWAVSARHAPTLSGLLIGLLLADSELYLAIGNPGGITVGFCVTATWCFLRERHIKLAVLCMAISLMLKPHICGLIWLFFLLAKGTYRKRAIQTLVVAVVLVVPAILWLSSVAPSWPSELKANLAANGAPGSLSDPGPNSSAGHGIGMIIDLQTVLSLVRDDPNFYNPVSYAIVGSLVLIWIVTTLRTRISTENAWFALAPISILSMLPIYHRLYDAKIMLLAMPACSILWHRGGGLARTAGALSFFAVFLTGALPWTVLLVGFAHTSWGRGPYSSIAKTLIQVLPVPLTLMAFGVFLLWVYLKYSAKAEQNEERAS